MERAPAATTRSIQAAIGRVIQTSEETRNAGNQDWWNIFHEDIPIILSYANYRWRPLEAALAATGSQSESILDYIEDEQESGRPKPIDIDYLLANVIPPVLNAGSKLCVRIRKKGA